MIKLEEVARAICVADGYDPDHEPAEGVGDERLWKNYLPMARAAVEALRWLPASILDQKEVVIARFGAGHWDGIVDHADVLRLHAAMIDAILNEKP